MQTSEREQMCTTSEPPSSRKMIGHRSFLVNFKICEKFCHFQ